IVSLSTEEQGELQAILHNRSLKVKAQVLKRAYMLLAADENGEHLSDSKIARHYKVPVRTVELLRKRCVEEGFHHALHGKPRSIFKHKTFDGRTEAHLIALRCSDPPKGHSGWTLHLLKERMIALGYVESISHETVRQMLKKKSA
ncbi:MAG TPA: helix-turn-helix domain-containing protein, partial [Flavisolibacter sp.]|nr:helix-turn-helix domain-containing protein [Flavisolibacter sp.]